MVAGRNKRHASQNNGSPADLRSAQPSSGMANKVRYHSEVPNALEEPCGYLAMAIPNRCARYESYVDSGHQYHVYKKPEYVTLRLTLTKAGRRVRLNAAAVAISGGSTGLSANGSAIRTCN